MHGVQCVVEGKRCAEGGGRVGGLCYAGSVLRRWMERVTRGAGTNIEVRVTPSQQEAPRGLAQQISSDLVCPAAAYGEE